MLLTPNASVARSIFPARRIMLDCGAKRLSMSTSSLLVTSNSALRSLWLRCLSCNRVFTHRDFEFCKPVEVSLVFVVSYSSSSGSEAVNSLLTVPNDDSGIFLLIPIGLFISKAVRATGSLLLSFAGGDTASLVGPSHSGAAWAAVQHRITARVGSVAGCS